MTEQSQKKSYRFRLNDFTRDILTLIAGTSVAQAIPILITPILSRLYSPADFGLFAVYMSITNMLIVIATARYELAIMLPKSDPDAVNIMGLSIGVSLAVSVVTLLTVYYFNSELTELLDNPGISKWLYLAPVVVLLAGLTQSYTYWNNRKRLYKRIATSRVIKSIITAISNVGLGLGGIGSGGLIIGNVLGQGIAAGFLGGMILKDNDKLGKFIHPKTAIELAKVYKKFPTWNLLSSGLFVFKESLTVIFLSRYFESSFVGFYYFSVRLLKLPVNVIVSAISDVYYQKLSQLENHNDIYNLSYHYLKLFFTVFIIPYIIFVLSLPYAIPFAFGNVWEGLDAFLAILSFPIFLNLISSHFSKILIIVNKQDMSFYFHSSKMVFYVAVILLIYRFQLFTIEAIKIFSVFELIWIYVGFIVTKKILGAKKRSYFMPGITIILIILCLLMNRG